MGGVQIPKKKKNIRRFDAILRHTQQIYVRDFQALADLKKYSYKKVDFFMDTSYFAIEWKKYKTPAQKYIVVNLNSRGEKFLGDIIRDITEYAQKGYIIYYVPISAGLDDDRVYFEKLKKKLPKKTDLQILEREHDFKYFLKILGGAEKVVGTRLHLYLISQFIGLDTIVYPYQRKIIRMQEVLSKVAV
ncbi:MAG: hypothetical protein CR971_01445 [candidate division SR1 bacterium]|nr:MAG: hypothetical protein CR971_01445 [candidate division SR1 bacterium]